MRRCWLWLLAGFLGWLGLAENSWAQPEATNGSSIYGSGEYLLWWLRPANLPVMATSDNALGGIPPGALGQPGTTVLLADDLGTGPNCGARFTAGWWLDRAQTLAIEGNFFFLGPDTFSRSFSSPGGTLGTPTIFRPFYDAVLGIENSQFIAGPAMTGNLNVSLLQRLMGSEANLRVLGLDNGRRLRCDLLGGFRFLALDENLDIRSLSFDPLGILPTTNTFESFAARNRFYGGQVGMETEWQRGSFSLKLLTKFALGCMNQVVNINGNAVVFDPTTGITVSGPATLFTQTTNIGRYERNQFAFIPEIGVTGGCWVTSFAKVSLGYTFLWLSSVTRPEDASDRVSTIPFVGLPPPLGVTNPAFTFRDASFWAQGINFGLELRF